MDAFTIPPLFPRPKGISVPRAQEAWRPVTVLVVEADQMNCELVRSAFRGRRSRISVVGATEDTINAMSVLKEAAPDVAVVSARLLRGALEGFVFVRNLHSIQPKTRIVMLLDSREKDLVIDAFRVGAHGVIFRDEPFQVLTKCIHAVHGGQIWVNSTHLGYMVDTLAQTMVSSPQLNGAEMLTKREEDVAKLLAEGMTNKEIAAHLHISEHTVRNYLFHMFDKLGVSSRVELLVRCLRQNPEDSAANGA